ncbi:MAG: hypothetical protein ACK53W_07675 [Gemmatimonadota bacterium]|jgi:hypothetical protein
MAVSLKKCGYENKPLFQVAKNAIADGGVVVDVGAGLRPQALVTGERHICVEPHGEYADALEAAGYTVVRDTAVAALEAMPAVDTIVALDVIEHMDKAEGLRFLDVAKRKAKQVVVFTPLGFLPQEETGATDAWGLHGQHWQKHRSGWMPKEFDGWITFVDRNFHDHIPAGAFVAVLRQ